jgi:hypothetical protein
MFQVDVFWVVTPCSVAVGYRRFDEGTRQGKVRGGGKSPQMKEQGVGTNRKVG